MLTSKKQQSISAFFSSTAANGSPSASAADNQSTSSAPPLNKQRKRVPPATDATEQHAKRRKASSGKTRSLPHTASDSDGEEQDTSSTRPSPVAGGATTGGATTGDAAKKKARLSERTSKYLFVDSSQSTGGRDAAGDGGSGAGEAEEDEPATKEMKQRLHQRFVKKLGQPGSLVRGKRRQVDEDLVVVEGDDGGPDGDEPEDEEDEQSNKKADRGSAKTSKGGPAASKKGAAKVTPLVRQVLEIKKKHLDTLLIVEVGYKFRFFGQDARIAAKELGIVCIPGKLRYDEHPSEAHLDRFASASIPVHRLHVHVKRLVGAGHKVGVVRQLETAALKAAGDNRNAPFERKLTNLYTKGTYVDDAEGLGGPVEGVSGGAPATGYLLCLTEANAKGWGTDEKVQVGILAVQPATGDVIYDDFEDGFMRSEMESRLLHIAPCEFLIVGQLSKATETVLQNLSANSVSGDKIRIERVDKPKTMTAEAHNHVTNFYANKAKASPDAGDARASDFLDKVVQLSEHVTVCLSALITHMTDYGLEHVFDLTKYFQSFSARSHMLLNGNTLTSLEIYRNQSDGSVKGSLFWCLDRTKTRFGQRLLRKWVGRPLLDRQQLEERVAAVDELRNGDRGPVVEKLKGLLAKTKTDLEKGLIRIYYGKCTRPELLTVLQTMQRIGNEFAFVKSTADVGFSSSVLNRAIASLPTIAEDVVQYLEKINPEAAKNDDKYTFLRDQEESEEITEQKLGIASVEYELDAHRAVAAEKLGKKKVEYVTVAGIEYLIEVGNGQLKKVPASWAKISGTKAVSRFHTPDVVQLIRERDQRKESLAAACDASFSALLAALAAQYQAFRDCVQSLALLDCLLSLAAVAQQPGYARPTFGDESGIWIDEGRHPMVEQVRVEERYVPNGIRLAAQGGGGARALLITGPNMGGKSSYVRQTALIAIMAQVGSWVPAAAARLGMLDAVFTRMGAADNMMAGQSTFMVELSETSDILKQASPRSLVILDELGRGTSTHDGLAIATAVLDHVVRRVQCLTLFITHYQTLSGMARAYASASAAGPHADPILRNVHMKFTESGPDGQAITFLYEVGDGVAHRSYGLNVARLAHIPASVLDTAAVKSRELECVIQAKRLTRLSQSLAELVRPRAILDGDDVDGDVEDGDGDDALQRLIDGIEQL
ncbi:MAG: Mismatch repair protein msh3 [Phylliscum demangeonii]|nr:MAG: Mismatch repair protein msh3 [Phylliscum demangeonii]